jgi:hypothetical protein
MVLTNFFVNFCINYCLVKFCLLVPVVCIENKFTWHVAIGSTVKFIGLNFAINSSRTTILTLVNLMLEIFLLVKQQIPLLILLIFFSNLPVLFIH